MPLEPDAQWEILLLWKRMEQEKVRQFCENDAMCAWAGKAHGKASRLAGLLALLENPDATTVSQKAAKAAVAMMEEYFIPHAVRAFCGEQKLSQPAASMLKVVKNAVDKGAQHIKQSELREHVRKQMQFKGEAGAANFAKGLVELQRAGMIRPYYIAQSATGRPNDGAWELNPALMKKEAAERAFEMPDYHYKGKTLEEIQWEKELEEDNGLPF